MSNCARFTRLPFALLALATACDDDDPSGPDGSNSLTAAEAAVLADVVATGGAVDPETAPVVELLLGEIREHGTISFAEPRVMGGGGSLAFLARVGGDFDAVAFQTRVEFSSGGDPEPPTVASGMVAWRGLDAAAETVDEYFLIVTVEETSEFPGTGSEVIAAVDGATAFYYVDATASSYSGTSGTFAWESATFGGSSTDCGTTVGPITINCSYLKGTMTGSLGFEAALVEGSGAATASFAEADYDLPALRFTISDEPPPATVR